LIKVNYMILTCTTDEMVQFSDLSCFKELPIYMLQAKDMQNSKEL
jgi:hypothetical protein